MTDLEKAVSTGQYNQPYKAPTFRMKAVRDENITFNDFISNKGSWMLLNRTMLSLEEMILDWKVILEQRLFFKAALLVYNGKYKGINHALKYLRISKL